MIFLCQGQQFLTDNNLLRDGGGTIDAMEIYEMVKGLFSMSGMEVSEEEVENCTKEILEAIDVDSDGDITKVNNKGRQYLSNSEISGLPRYITF